MPVKKENNGSSSNVKMKDYVDKVADDINANIKHLEAIMDDKFHAQDAVNKQSDLVLNERLGRMNEFREQINSERTTYATKDSLDMMLKPIDKAASLAAATAEDVSKSYTRLMTLIGIMLVVILGLLGYLLAIHIHV